MSYLNPRKDFNFRIIIGLLNPILVQEVTQPDIEIEKVEHGEANTRVKTAGQRVIGDLIVKKLLENSPDMLDGIWAWLESVQSSVDVGGSPALIYKKNITIQHLATDGVTPIGQWEYLGAWPCKVNGMELNRMGSKNIIEEITFSVDEVLKVI